jgi:Fe-S cluster biogenesis protein NfuA
MTLKQGVQNLLCHYLPEVKELRLFKCLMKKKFKAFKSNDKIKVLFF